MSNSIFDLSENIVPKLLSLTIVGLFLCYVIIIGARFLLTAYVFTERGKLRSLPVKAKIAEIIVSLTLLTADFLSGSHLKDHPLVTILQNIVYYTFLVDFLIFFIDLLVFLFRINNVRLQGSIFVIVLLIDFYLLLVKLFISQTLPNYTFLYLPMIVIMICICYVKFIIKKEITVVLSKR